MEPNIKQKQSNDVREERLHQHVFSGLTFGLCGDISHDQLKSIIEGNDGIIESSIEKCDFLISTPSSTEFSNYKRAIELRIPIITLEYIDICVQSQEHPCHFDCNNVDYYLHTPNRRDITKEYKIGPRLEIQPDYHSAFEKAGLLITLTEEEEENTWNGLYLSLNTPQMISKMKYQMKMLNK